MWKHFITKNYVNQCYYYLVLFNIMSLKMKKMVLLVQGCRYMHLFSLKVIFLLFVSPKDNLYPGSQGRLLTMKRSKVYTTTSPFHRHYLNWGFCHGTGQNQKYGYILQPFIGWPWVVWHSYFQGLDLSRQLRNENSLVFRIFYPHDHLD